MRSGRHDAMDIFPTHRSWDAWRVGKTQASPTSTADPLRSSETSTCFSPAYAPTPRPRGSRGAVRGGEGSGQRPATAHARSFRSLGSACAGLRALARAAGSDVCRPVRSADPLRRPAGPGLRQQRPPRAWRSRRPRGSARIVLHGAVPEPAPGGSEVPGAETPMGLGGGIEGRRRTTASRGGHPATRVHAIRSEKQGSAGRHSTGLAGLPGPWAERDDALDQTPAAAAA